MKININELPDLPRDVHLRLTKTNYKLKNRIVRWDGKRSQTMCEHDLRKNNCRECEGSSVCKHNRRKNTCKECKGASICQHNRERYICKECNGRGICDHNRQKSRCKECDGVSICDHNRERSKCKECGGSSICDHNRLRPDCWKCSAERLPNNFCRLCKQVFIRQAKYKKYEGYCFSCYCFTFPDKPIVRQVKFKETYLHQELTKRLPEISFIRDKRVEGGCSSRKPDFFLDLLTHCIIIENDEFQHANYTCENRRTMEIYEDLGRRPLVFLRFNPDAYYDEEGKHHKSCFSTNDVGKLEVDEKLFQLRCDVLEKQIRFYLSSIPEKAISDIKLFYNE